MKDRDHRPHRSSAEMLGFFFNHNTMYYTYILYSKNIDRYYIGMSENPERRLLFHLSGISKYTSRASDWSIVYLESFQTKAEAMEREKQIKRWKSRKKIEELIRSKM